MFKPLIRVLPSLSGNVKLICNLTEYDKLENNYFETNVRSARMSPLSSNLFSKYIPVSLLNSSYEWDIKTFYKFYNNYFWDGCFEYSKIDVPKIDKYNINNVRNTDFEFGVHRDKYSRNETQFGFFAPIYIECEQDLPDYFMIDIILSNQNISTTKHIKININDLSNRNYLSHYLHNYAKFVDDEVIFCKEDKTATVFGIDLIHGGFTKSIDNQFIKLYTFQNTLLNLDNIICGAFKRNNIVMRQIIPLCFNFNINDILDEVEIKNYKFSSAYISGNWYKDGKKINFYDFDLDYTEYYHKIKKINEDYGTMNLVQTEKNIMDVPSPGLNESRYINYRFANKITPTFSRWKLKYSSDEDPYITNLNYAFSYNLGSNFIYHEYPHKHSLCMGICDMIINGVNSHFNLVLPLGRGKKYYKNNKSEILYKNYIKNRNLYCSDWFSLLNSKKIKYDDIINNKDFKDVHSDNKIFYNGILYNFNNIYDAINLENKIDKFGVFVSLDWKYINNENFDDHFFAENVIYTQNSNYITNSNTFINDNVLSDDNIQLYNDNLKSLNYSHQIDYNQIFVKNHAHTGDFIDLLDYGINYYDINKYYMVEDICYVSAVNKINHPIINTTFGESLYSYVNSLHLKQIFDEPNAFLGRYRLPLFRESQLYNETEHGFYTNVIPNEHISNLCDNNEVPLTRNLLSYTYTSGDNELYSGELCGTGLFVSYNFLTEYCYNLFIESFENSYTKDVISNEARKYVNDLYSKYFSKNLEVYKFNTNLVKPDFSIYDKKVFTKNTGLCKEFYGDKIPQDRYKNDNDVLYIDPYNYNNIVDHYNNTWFKNSEKLSYITISEYNNENNSLTWYAKFLDMSHLKYYIKYLYRDQNLEGNKFDALDTIFIRKRYIHKKYNYGENISNTVDFGKFYDVHDEYIPLSKYFKFEDFKNLETEEANVLFDLLAENIYESLIYDEECKYWTFKNIKYFKGKYIKFNINLDEIKDLSNKEIDEYVIDNIYLDNPFNLSKKTNIESGRDINHKLFKFDLCYKKCFYKIDKDIFERLINIKEVNKRPYKDLYIYRIEKDFEYNKYINYYFTENILSNTQYCECLTPLFNIIYMEDVQQAKICCEYLLGNISKSNVINNNVSNYRVDKNNLVCLYDISTLNKDKPTFIKGKNYFTYSKYNELPNYTYEYLQLPEFNINVYSYINEDGYSYSIHSYNESYIYTITKTNETYTYSSVGVYSKENSFVFDKTFDKFASFKTKQQETKMTYVLSYIEIEEEIIEEERISYNIYNKITWEEYLDGLTDNEKNNLTYYKEFNESSLSYTYKVPYTFTIEVGKNYKEKICYTDELIKNFDDLGLWKEFKLNSYSYFDDLTGKVTNYAWYDFNVEITNTNNSFNIKNLSNKPMKFISYINGVQINTKDSEDYIYDIYKNILPMQRNVTLLSKLISNSYIVQNPKQYFIPKQYNQVKSGNYGYVIMFNPNSKETFMVERYMDHIVPNIQLITDSTINTYQFKFKDVNKSFGVSYFINEPIYKTEVNLNYYEGLPIYDTFRYTYKTNVPCTHDNILMINHNTYLSYTMYKDVEYKHFNDNKYYNLEPEIIIEIDDKLTLGELYKYQTRTKTLEVFMDYINNTLNTHVNENQILFLFNKYDIKYLHNSNGLSDNLSEKIYNLKYKFTLL